VDNPEARDGHLADAVHHETALAALAEGTAQ
jgi:hypothetical protein